MLAAYFRRYIHTLSKDKYSSFLLERDATLRSQIRSSPTKIGHTISMLSARRIRINIGEEKCELTVRGTDTGTTVLDGLV